MRFASVRITRLDKAWYRENPGYYLGFVADDDEFWDVVESVKSLPLWARRWDPEAPGGRAWWIMASYITMLYSTFPGLQERVSLLSGGRWDQPSGTSGYSSTSSSVPTRVTDAFGVLFLVPKAPFLVVNAVYRALAKTTHPDTGGNTQAMQRLNAAYEIAADWAKRKES